MLTLTGYSGLPRRQGKLKDIHYFDAGFFGVVPKQCVSMDPQMRLLQEVTYEAILDAGTRTVDSPTHSTQASIRHRCAALARACSSA
jgi:acyl transferase domain-containing protein